MFLKTGNTYVPASPEALDLHHRLPPGTYSVKLNEKSGQFYLETITPLTTSGKVYGNALALRDRILTTFHDRPTTTGVLLSGIKGSGKTMLARLIAEEAARQEIPNLLVNQPFAGEGFNSFIQAIDQPAVVIFDEFEKVYSGGRRNDPYSDGGSAPSQDALLTLLDGVYPSKKLFILTSNDRHQISQHMLNRPGRIFYRIEYGGLDEDFIREYCADTLVNQEHVESVVRLSFLFAEFNFDILKALVEDMNRYNEDAHQVMALLNAKPEQGAASNYDVELTINGTRVTAAQMPGGTQWQGQPMKGVRLEYELPEDEDEGENDWRLAIFNPSDLLEADVRNGVFRFQSDGLDLRLKRRVVEHFAYDGLY